LDRLGSQVLAHLLSFVVLSSLLLLPFGLDANPSPFVFLHLPTVAAEFLFIVAVFLRPDCRRYVSSLTGFQGLLLATLFVYVLWVSFISPIPTSFLLGQFWLLHIVFFVALICFYRSSELADEDPIWMVFGLAALLHVGAFLCAWALWPEQIRMNALPAFENIRFLGYFVAPASVVTAVLFATRRDYLLLPFLCFLAASFYIIYTGSRGGAVGIVAGLMAGAAHFKLKRQKVPASRVIILIIAIGLLILTSELLPKLPWAPLFDHAHLSPDQSSSQALNGRQELWADVGAAIKERWMFGYGAAFVTHVFSYALDPTVIQNSSTEFRNTHNIVLQLLLHWGVIGSLLIVVTALAFARNICRALTQKPDRALIPSVVLVTMLVHSLVSGVFFYPYSTVIAIIAFASVACIGSQKRCPCESQQEHTS
jgi:O-antigen ligase